MDHVTASWPGVSQPVSSVLVQPFYHQFTSLSSSFSGLEIFLTCGDAEFEPCDHNERSLCAMASLVGRLPRTLHPSSSMTMANDDEDELALLSEDDIMLADHSKPRASSPQNPYTPGWTSKQKGKAPSSAGSSKRPREESVSKENVWVAIADLRNNYCGVQDEFMECEKRLSAVEAYPEAIEEMVESAMNTLHARIADDLAEVRDQGTREDKSGTQG